MLRDARNVAATAAASAAAAVNAYRVITLQRATRQSEQTTPLPREAQRHR